MATTNTPKQTEPKTEPKTLTDRLYAQISTVKPEDRDIPEVQFMRALELERQKVAIQKQIAANRSFLRIMADSEALTDDLADWLEIFYPSKERGDTRSRDEVEETRKNHEAAATLASK